MTTARQFALVATIVILGLTTFQAARITARQGEALRTARSRQAALARELAAARQRAAAATATLADVERELAAALADPANRVDSPEARIAAETRGWLARLGTLKRHFAEHPEASIPELQLLDLRGWLVVSKGVQLDTAEHVRQALADIRGAAKREFTNRLASALRTYLNTRDGELPDNLLALAPFFNPPVDLAILERYRMARRGNLAAAPNSNAPAVLEKAAVDDEYDARHGVNVGRMADNSRWAVVPGSFGGPGPAAWIDDYQDRLKRARADFARAHPEAKGAGLADYAPYFNPPLDPEKVTRIIAREKAQAR